MDIITDLYIASLLKNHCLIRGVECCVKFWWTVIWNDHEILCWTNYIFQACIKKSSLFFGFFNFIFEWKCDNIEHSKSIKFIQMLNYGDTLNVCCFKIYCKLHLQCFRQGVTEKLFSNSLQVKSITHPFGWPFFDDL